MLIPGVTLFADGGEDVITVYHGARDCKKALNLAIHGPSSKYSDYYVSRDITLAKRAAGPDGAILVYNVPRAAVPDVLGEEHPYMGMFSDDSTEFRVMREKFKDLHRYLDPRSKNPIFRSGLANGRRISDFEPIKPPGSTGIASPCSPCASPPDSISPDVAGNYPGHRGTRMHPRAGMIRLPTITNLPRPSGMSNPAGFALSAMNIADMAQPPIAMILMGLELRLNAEDHVSAQDPFAAEVYKAALSSGGTGMTVMGAGGLTLLGATYGGAVPATGGALGGAATLGTAAFGAGLATATFGAGLAAGYYLSDATGIGAGLGNHLSNFAGLNEGYLPPLPPGTKARLPGDVQQMPSPEDKPSPQCFID